MSNRRYSCLARTAALALIVMGASAGGLFDASKSEAGESAEVRLPHLNQLTFDFLASGADGSATMRLNSSEDAIADRKRSQGLDDDMQDDWSHGSIVTSSDLLGLSAPPVESQKPGSLFGPSTLIGRLESVNDTNIISFDVADCSALDFDAVSGDLFEERAICDADIYSYDLTEHGFRVLKNGEKYWEIPLTPGLYLLNGVVLEIQKSS